MPFKIIVFDLDGTLVDSRLDLVAAVQKLRHQQNLPPLPQERIIAAIGDGATELLRRTLADAPQLEVLSLLPAFQKIYAEAIAVHTRPYPGVLALLHALQQRQVPLAVLTNKPQHLSEMLLHSLGLTDFFFANYGPEGAACRKPDPAGLLRLLQLAACSPAQALMVGDHYTDARTAAAAGLPYAHHSAGLGLLQPEDPQPAFTFDQFSALQAWLLPRL